MKRFLPALFIFVVTGLYVSGQSFCSSQRYIDTIFHRVDDTTNIYFATAIPFGVLAQPQDLYMDIYSPHGDTISKRPLIVFQFGGGFTIGWRTEPDIPAFCTYFAQLGYVVATIDYRIGLNPLDTASTVRAFYRGVQDERSALRFLCQRAEQFRLDTNNIILTGTSAGCYCAFANAFMTDADRPQSTFGSALEPDDMGCMDCSGNNDFGHRIPHIKAIVDQWGAVLDTSYIEPGENTPCILIQGDQDNIVPYTYGYPFQLPVFPPTYGALPIHQRMDNIGLLNVLHPLVGYSHEPELLAPQLNDTIYNYSRRFLYPLLRPQTPAIVGPSAICEGDTAIYSVVNNDGSKFCWQLSGNGQIAANNNTSIAVVWSDTGNVWVAVKELSYLQAEGDTQTFATHVLPRPIANFGYVVNQLQVTLNNWSTDAGNYNWDFGDGTTSTDTNNVKLYSTGGAYTITLIAGNGLCADTFSSAFNVDSCPVAHFTYQLTNNNGFFYADTTNTGIYHWNFGDGDSAIVPNENVFHQYAQNGTYYVTLQVQNQLGCVSIDTVMLTITQTSVTDLTANGALIICGGNQICNITISGTQAATVSVFDIAGRLIAHKKFTYSTQVETSSYAPGLYLLKVESGKYISVTKFEKK